MLKNQIYHYAFFLSKPDTYNTQNATQPLIDLSDICSGFFWPQAKMSRVQTSLLFINSITAQLLVICDIIEVQILCS